MIGKLKNDSNLIVIYRYHSSVQILNVLMYRKFIQILIKIVETLKAID